MFAFWNITLLYIKIHNAAEKSIWFLLIQNRLNSNIYFIYIKNLLQISFVPLDSHQSSRVLQLEIVRVFLLPTRLLSVLHSSI